MHGTRQRNLRTMSAPVWWLQLQMHIHSRHQHQYRHRSSQKTLSVKVSCFGVARALVSVTASVCVSDVQVRGERAITQRVPEILPADPVVTNIKGSI